MRIVSLIVTLEPEEWFDNCLTTTRRILGPLAINNNQRG